MDYLGYFNLKEAPFALTPDPAFLFLTESHKRALEGLARFVAQGEGYAVLWGDIGTGKTTVCRAVLERLGPQVEASLVVNPFLGEVELLRAIAADFGVEAPEAEGEQGGGKVMEAIRAFLVDAHSKGKRALVIIDEAHNLPVSAMEQLRIVGNLETNKEKLLQVLLVGQPELIPRLSGPRVRQLHQRIARWYKLEPLSKHDIEPYFHYRLEHAGIGQKLRLSREASRLAHKLTEGYPRRLNMLFSRTLQRVADHDSWTVGPADIRKAGEDLPPQRDPAVQPRRGASSGARRLAMAVAGAALVVVAFAVGFGAQGLSSRAEPNAEHARPAAPAGNNDHLRPSGGSRWAISLGAFDTQAAAEAHVLKAPVVTGTGRFLVPQDDGTFLACIGYFRDAEQLDLFVERLVSEGFDAEVKDASLWRDSGGRER